MRCLAERRPIRVGHSLPGPLSTWDPRLPLEADTLATMPPTEIVRVDPEIMSGAPCFAGTRVPVQHLVDYLVGGESVEQFLDDFPTVKRDQVVSFLELAGELIGDRAHPAR